MTNFEIKNLLPNLKLPIPQSAIKFNTGCLAQKPLQITFYRKHLMSPVFLFFKENENVVLFKKATTRQALILEKDPHKKKGSHDNNFRRGLFYCNRKTFRKIFGIFFIINITYRELVSKVLIRFFGLYMFL